MKPSAPKRLLFVTAGSHGDINPFISLALAARARGHEARVAANPYFRAQIEEAGVGFEPLGDFIDLRALDRELPDIMHPRRSTKVLLEALLVPIAATAFHRVKELAGTFKPDAVVHHFICFGAAWACEQLNLPAANTVLAPLNWMSRTDVLSPMSWMPLNPPGWLASLMFGMIPLMDWSMDRRFNAVRRELGLPRTKSVMFGGMRGGKVNLGLWSTHLRGPTSDDPPGGHICGYAWHDRHGEVEGGVQRLREFMDSGEPPILFCLGTAAVHVAGDFYEHAAEACWLLGRRGVLLVGPGRRGPQKMPAGVETFEYAPFSWVMPRCAANVHHGGIGSTGQALRAGRPTVVIPHAHDQFDNAARVKRLGVSETVARPRVTGRSLATALARVLERRETAERAASLGALIAKEDGAAEAIAHVERSLLQL
ncbi:MAG: glycosyltransferase family 1 protein [Planctomycetes bacterium]|nr:glycosyltransferase family 1 protein [Planctomycetota bacterium]